MDFQHVTFDLPHGTFHALQGGDPDGQLTLVSAALCKGQSAGLLKSWVRNCLKEGYSVDIVLIIARYGAPNLPFPRRQHRKLPPIAAGTMSARGAPNSRQAKSVVTAVIGGEKFESFEAERRILAEGKARLFVFGRPLRPSSAIPEHRPTIQKSVTL
jgi:hypothetical protein